MATQEVIGEHKVVEYCLLDIDPLNMRSNHSDDVERLVGNIRKLPYVVDACEIYGIDFHGTTYNIFVAVEGPAVETSNTFIKIYGMMHEHDIGMFDSLRFVRRS